jgi:type IV pilus assembly protein PilY1
MKTFPRFLLRKTAIAALVAGTVVGSASGAPVALQDVPLYLLSRADPNVLINMSVETPMGGAAYTDHVGVPAGCTGRTDIGGRSLGACYFPATEYLGYFNPRKCYAYASTQFNPTSTAAGMPNHTCSGEWSGNFLNWVSMTAIDMFIMTMTGGNRIVDTTGGSAETVVRRARKTDNDSWYPIKYVNSSTNVAPNTVTPYGDATLYFYNTTFGFNVGTTFDEARNGSGTGFKGSFTAAARVCSSTPAGLDDANCVSYGSYSKPEGSIQRNARTKRFGAISYSTDGSNTRDGGVLRSNMKYVGPTLPDGSTNSVAEFLTDGTLVHNPDGATGGLNSGVINYINKFSDAAYKSLDPVSELFYESIRYFKNLGPTPEYSAGLTTGQMGGFQIVNSWSDPQQYKCQKNFIIAINDANPWLDKRLPGTFFTSSTISGASGTVTLDGNDYGEPSNADNDINVRDLTNRVGAMEGLHSLWSDSGTWVSTGASGSVSGVNDSVGGGSGTFDNGCGSKTVTALGEVMGTCPYAPKQNSYYVAGLAYYANTTDLRSDFPNDRGIQNVQTFMIDTQEFNNNPLDGPKNMLWLTGKYGGFNDADADATPDPAEWDADSDGVPDNYVLATQPQNLVNGLDRAFDFIDSRLSSASSASVNSGSISDLTRIYQTRFNSGTWTGQLLAFAINDDGTLGNGVPPLTDAEAEWDAAQELPAWGSRQIITRDSTGADIAFRWNSLDTPRQTQLGSEALLEYLRGNGTNEGNVAGRFRPRLVSKLGDIVSSAPLFVGRPPFRYRDNLEGSGSVAYSTFVAANDTDAERAPMVYAGANDGMLHGFNANTGVEVFAFVPTPMFKLIGAGPLARITRLAQQNYVHEYFVDGSPSLGDAYWGGAWHTVIAGGLNKGGQGIYALDVTSTSRLAAAETLANAQDTILWEFTDVDDADLGLTFSQPSIVKSHDTTAGGTGRWVVAFGNGYNSTLTDGASSTTGNAVLFIRDAATGAHIAKLDTGIGNAQRPTGVAWDNGLSTPTFVDLDADRIVDYAYAGDLYGNMWKFDLRDANPANWKVAYGTTTKRPLFTAVDASGNRQPITVRPEVTRGPKGAGMLVLFGTGKYLEPADLLDSPVRPQSFYGIIDRNTGSGAVDRVTSRAALTQQTIDNEVTYDPPDPDGATNPLPDPPPIKARITSDNPVGDSGWYMDLVSPVEGYQNEKQVSTPIVRNGNVIFTTVIPEANPCSGGGRSWIMELSVLSGRRLDDAPFDINNDGKFDDQDLIPVTDANGDTVYIPPSALASEDGMGILQSPGVVDGEREAGPVQYKYSPGSSGSIQRITENPGSGTTGRQSWRQIR